jgi:hypothetical protein
MLNNEHSITIDADFGPRRLLAYRIPEVRKPKIQRQIEELLRNAFIRLSNSPMASPIVAVLKGTSSKGEECLAIDYCFVNHHSQGDTFVMPLLLDTIQKIGETRCVSVGYAWNGYWQLGMGKESKW